MVGTVFQPTLSTLKLKTTTAVTAGSDGLATIPGLCDAVGVCFIWHNFSLHFHMNKMAWEMRQPPEHKTELGSISLCTFSPFLFWLDLVTWILEICSGICLAHS